ncbi:MAG: response regulator transcription factor [Treponema sp.]|nr:response regulator transcription factor [Treponema sp.]
MSALILLVEDNEQILQGNERMLKRRGYTVATAKTLAEARARLEEQTPDAIVLDIMLPDGSGLAFMRELRRAAHDTSHVPILLLTGLTTPEDVVRGLSQGGDDYLAKPYDFGVLLARIEALLRRAEQFPKILRKGVLQLDIIAGRAFLNGSDMLLSPKEFALLLLMVQNEGKLLTTASLYEAIWKLPLDTDTTVIRTAVSRLRQKLGCEFSIENDKQQRAYIFTQISSS